MTTFMQSLPANQRPHKALLSSQGPKPPIRDRGNFGLIWLGGYGGEAYHVYLGASEAAVAKADTDSAEFKGTQSGNVLSLRGMKLIAVNYWRIDTVVGEEVVRGEVWRFTCGEED